MTTPTNQDWLDNTTSYIEAVAGGTLPADLKQFVHDKLLSLVCEVLMHTVDADKALTDDLRALGAVPKHARASDTFSRAAYQFDNFAERGIEHRF